MALAESFFPNGGAFAVTRRAYEDAGGFDPALFAYYDDLDLGWRLRMAGHGIRTVADAVAYHRHGATVGTQPHAHKRFVLARNALWIALRNYDDRTLPHVLPAILMLARPARRAGPGLAAIAAARSAAAVARSSPHHGPGAERVYEPSSAGPAGGRASACWPACRCPNGRRLAPRCRTCRAC